MPKITEQNIVTENTDLQQRESRDLQMRRPRSDLYINLTKDMLVSSYLNGCQSLTNYLQGWLKSVTTGQFL